MRETASFSLALGMKDVALRGSLGPAGAFSPDSTKIEMPLLKELSILGLSTGLDSQNQV